MAKPVDTESKPGPKPNRPKQYPCDNKTNRLR